jgi:Ribosome biogenesis protein SLX9
MVRTNISLQSVTADNFQAPTILKKRPSLRTKSTTTTSKSGSGLMSRPSVINASISDSFINSKKDKRIIKHSSFIHRIEKAHKKPLKRRRPSKKLVTSLESLGAVLGDIEVAATSGLKGIVGSDGEGKITQKTLKVGPGALTRRVKMERMERERFGKNMAQLMGSERKQRIDLEAAEKLAVGGTTEPVGGTSAIGSRWAALRGFISQTMKQKEEFRRA